MTRTSEEVNRVLADKDFPLENFATLQDLLNHLDMGDARGYMFIGKRYEGDSSGVPLIPQSSLKGLMKVVAFSHHIGGC